MRGHTLSGAMSILCVTPWFPAKRGEQAGNFIFDSVEALVELGHRVSVLVTEPWRPALAGLVRPEWERRTVTATAFDNAFAISRVRYPSLPNNIGRPFVDKIQDARIGSALRQVLADDPPDVIHGHTEGVAPVVSRAGRAAGIPTIVTLHGINTASRLLTPRHLAYLGRGLAATNRIVLVGEPLLAHFAPIAGRDDTFRIVHNGFRPPDTIRFVTPDDRPISRFVSVSNLHEGKGIDITLRALAKLHDAGIGKWTYTIVGAGSEVAALTDLVSDLGLGHCVTFAGSWPHSRIYEQLVAADVFVLPSYREAFGIAYLEAMAAGLLAIGVRGQGPEAFIRSGETGYLVAPQSVDDLAACLRQAIADPLKSRYIASAGQRHILKDFTWRRHAEMLTKVFVEARFE